METELFDIITNKPGYAGETARTLTEYYYNFCYDENDLVQSAFDLITYRTSLYSRFAEINQIKSEFIDNATVNFYDNIPCILFICFYLENAYDQGQKLFIDENIKIIYSVVMKEHVKTAKRLKLTPIAKQMTVEESSILKNILEEQSNN